MGLLSIFQRRGGATAAPLDAAAIATERRRARRRLLGAVVLVLAGVVGLPMLFDRAPRPLPVDIPIEIPRKDAVPPLAIKPDSKPEGATVAPAEPVAPAASAQAARETAIADRGKPADGVPDKPVARSAPEKPVEKPADKPQAEKSQVEKSQADKKPDTTQQAAAAAKAAEAKRAQAALEGRPAAAVRPADTAARSADASTRFVVQIGAFSEADSAREARLRVEKLGLRTYTQVVDTSGGKRIRVRLGPYDDRSEAEKVAAKIKQAGITSAVLTL